MDDQAQHIAQHMAAQHIDVLEQLADIRARLALLERTCQNDPPGGQGGSTFDPPGHAEGPVPPSEPPTKNASLEWMSFPTEAPFLEPEIFPKKISGEE